MLRTLVRHEVLTDRMLEAAMVGTAPAWLAAIDKAEEPDQKETRAERARKTRELIDGLIASFIQEQRAPGADEWELLGVTPAQLSSAADVIAQPDLECLEDLVLRIRTADEITATSTGADLLPDAEVGAETLQEFRGEPGRGPSGPNGSDVVGLPAVGPSRVA